MNARGRGDQLSGSDRPTIGVTDRTSPHVSGPASVNAPRSRQEGVDGRTLFLAEANLVLGRVERATHRATARPVFGPRGYGHSHDRAELIDDEANEIRAAARRVLRGESLSSVVRDWNQRGLRTATGRLWRVNSLSALLIQPRLAGYQVDARGVYTLRWPSILDRRTHDRLVALRTSRSTDRRRPRRSLLAGLVKCGKCGGSLHYLLRNDASDLYRCPAPAAGGCSGVTINAEAVEVHVRDVVIARVDSDEFMAIANQQLKDVVELGDDVEDLVRRIRAHRESLKDLAKLWSRRDITMIEWRQARREIARDLAGEEATLRDLEARMQPVSIAGRGAHFRERWAQMTVPEKRAVISSVVKCVVVDPVGRRRAAPPSERIRTVWLSW